MRLKILAVSFLIVAVVAFLGSIFTSGNVNSDWYLSVKSSITPPNYVFPIAWTILFILIAISLYFALIRSRNKKKILLVYCLNFIFNVLWSLFFFQLKNPLLGFIDIILVFFSIILIMVYVRKISISFYLLFPYLLWVGFASILNFLAIG